MGEGRLIWGLKVLEMFVQTSKYGSLVMNLYSLNPIH